MSTKEAVLTRIGKMPDTATLAEIREELEILAALDEAEQDIDAGHGQSPDEVRQQIRSWITK